MEKILIDTQIFVYALKNPFIDENHPLKELTNLASEIVKDSLIENIILLSPQLLAEIYHILSFRGVKLPINKTKELINLLLDSNKTIFSWVDEKIFYKAMFLSSKTNIHIWDFLVVLPFEGNIDKIYSIDPHFRDCKELQIANLENPLNIWQSESSKNI